MPIPFSALSLTNTSQIGGEQTGVRTIGLANGGFVVAWNSSASAPEGQTVHFQRYDGLGNPEGALTQVSIPGSIGAILQDIAVTDDGSFTLLTRVALGAGPLDQRLVMQSFSGETGTANAAPTVLNLSGLGPNGILGAQITPVSGAGDAVVVTALVVDAGGLQDLVRASVTTAGTITQAPVVVLQNASGNSGLIETVEAPNGAEFAISPTQILGTGTPTFALSGQKDIISIVPGTLVTAAGIASSPNVFLSMRVGSGTDITSYGVGSAVQGTAIVGATTAGAQSFATELVDLGAGRIMIAWVADGGDSFVGSAMTDGVYAQVYNMNSGSFEGTATLIRGFGTGPNDATLQQIEIGASVMADGRVMLGLSFFNGVAGRDVFNTILDARVEGITLVSSVAVSETFVGTAFDDNFSSVANGDTIVGGSGSDTVSFGDVTARNVDLQFVDAVPSNSFSLTGIENLIGNAGNDTLRGEALANILSGLGGNDIINGRDGNDSLLGGTGNDLATGGNGNDLISGEAGADTLQGDGGNDLMFGGLDNDRMLGGAGDDILNGAELNDRLFGDDGNDLLSGDAGDDTISGGLGDDEIFGGTNNDILRAESGADKIYGGSENDLIIAHADVALVDGGSGTDTLRLTGALDAGDVGIFADLTGVFDQLGTLTQMTRFEADISGIENLTGGTASDFLVADSAVNILRGGSGNDTLVSGLGADTQFGGAGADVFVFTGTNGGADVLGDVSFGTDKIGLLDGAFADINATNIASRLTINATGTVGATAFAQLIFDNAATGFGRLLFDADGNGAGAAVLLATLTPTTGALVAISETDFLFL